MTNGDTPTQPVGPLMPQAGIIGFGIYFVLLDAVLIYVLLKIWPQAIPIQAKTVTFPAALVFQFQPETLLLVIVAVTGALGAYVDMTARFVAFVGGRRLEKSWSWWYILHPFIGSALAIVLYFVYRGGLITGDAGAQHLSPYGVAAISGMAGLSSKQATAKLKQLFDTLFQTTT